MSRRFLRALARTLLLLLLVAAGTLLLLRFAPGYLADAREMDAQYASAAHAELAAEQAHSTLAQLARTFLAGWRNGSFGLSRQYQVPVRQLLPSRLAATANLLARGILLGWLLAFAAALPVSAAGRRGAPLLSLPFTLLLAVPAAVLATLSVTLSLGGPALVLALLLAARDFKFLEQLLRTARTAPALLHARAVGLSPIRIVLHHLLPAVFPQMLSIALLSLVFALSAIVPVEVLFDAPGIGQLAWNAAMNRDLPVLLATTLLVAAAVALAGLATRLRPAPEAAA